MLKQIVVALIILAVLAVVAVLKQRIAAPVKIGAYYLRKSLFTAAERSFLGVLEPMLPSEVRVFAKVRLADIFGVVSGLERGARQGAQNRINQKHVDFLIVRTCDLAPLAGIELDDSSHDEEDRQQRDAFVDEVFNRAKLPLLHVPVQKSYAPAEIKSKVEAHLS
jgi:hypothetical protein